MALWTSTVGVAPVTVTLSSTEPTCKSALTVAVKAVGSSIPRRTTDVNPARLKVTSYTPGRRSMMVYRPSSFVTAVLDFSISAGLEASTVAPGSTAPVVSLTTPAMPVVCAETSTSARKATANAAVSSAATVPLTVRVLTVTSGLLSHESAMIQGRQHADEVFVVRIDAEKTGGEEQRREDRPR